MESKKMISVTRKNNFSVCYHTFSKYILNDYVIINEQNLKCKQILFTSYWINIPISVIYHFFLLLFYLRFQLKVYMIFNTYFCVKKPIIVLRLWILY